MPTSIPKHEWNELSGAVLYVSPATLSMLLEEASVPVLVSFQTPGSEALAPVSRELVEIFAELLYVALHGASQAGREGRARPPAQEAPQAWPTIHARLRGKPHSPGSSLGRGTSGVLRSRHRVGPRSRTAELSLSQAEARRSAGSTSGSQRLAST